MPAILFALISYLGWGSGDIFGTIATRKLGPYSVSLWSNIIWLIILAPIGVLTINELSSRSIFSLVFSFLLGIIGSVIAFIAFYEALRIGPVSLVGTIVGSFAALTVILSIVFLGEKITIEQSISILIIFLGVILSSLNFAELMKRKFVLGRGTVLALVAMICWGVYWALIKIPVKEIGWFWPLYIGSLTSPLIFIIAKFRKVKINSPIHNGGFRYLFVSALLLTIGGNTFNYAISKGLVSIVAPIAGSYPTLFVILAFLVFKDKITKQQILGIVTTLVGIVLLSFFSV